MEKQTLNLPTVPRRFLKKRNILVAITICLCLVIVATTFVVPRSAAKIPLELSYTVGEKMVYYTTEQFSSQIINADLGASEDETPNWTRSSINFTEVIAVTDFDGEKYTLKHSHAISGIPISSFSYEEIVNRTGYSTYIYPPTSNSESTNKSGISNPALVAFIDKSEVTVGDTWVLPINSISSTRSTTGNITVTFTGIQNLTVPAGTFDVFRVDTNSTVQIRMLQWNTPAESSMTTTGQTYLDYDTGRQIQRDLHIHSVQPINNQGIGFNESGNAAYRVQEIEVQTQLIEIVNPGENSTNPLVAPSPFEQPALSFLRDIAGVDLDNYDVQFKPLLEANSVKCVLLSDNSTVDVFFNFKDTRIYWCKLYPLRGSPVFLESSANNLDGAKSFLDRYQVATHASYIPVFRSMIDHFSWLNETWQGGTFGSPSQSFEGKEVKLDLTVNRDIYRFSWHLEDGDLYQSILAVTVRDGHFESFTDSYIKQGTVDSIP